MLKLNKKSIAVLTGIVLLTPMVFFSVANISTAKSPVDNSAVNRVKPQHRSVSRQAIITAEDKWHVADAACRLTIKSDKPELPGYINLSELCLPDNIANGLDIRDGKGNKLSFKVFPDYGVVIDAAPKAAVRYIYFGFFKPLITVSADDKKTHKGTRLKLTVIRGKLNYLTGDAWLKDQQSRIIKRNEWREKSYRKSIDQYLERGILPRINFAISQCCWWDLNMNRQLLAVDTYQQYDLNWRPPNSHFIDMRSMRKYNYLLFTSLNRYFGTVAWRVRALKNLPAGQKKQLAKLHGQVKTAPKKEFLKLFNEKQKRWKRRIRGTKTVREVNLERRPFNSRRHFGAIFTGKLVIKERGNYKFAINSTSSAMLKIDDKDIFTWLGVHDRAPGWGKTVSINLDAGLHDLKFYYHKANGFTFATLAWQPPGSNDFRLMNENDFAPGWINPPLACHTVTGKNYPLVKRTPRQLFYTGKRQRARWTHFKLLSANVQNYVWEYGGRKLANGNEADIVFTAEEEENAVIRDLTDNSIALKLHPVPETDNLSSVNPDLKLKLWLPYFIYDDELLKGQIEISSGLTSNINCNLVINASRKNSILPDETKNFVIPGKPLNEQYKFASDSTLKNKIVIKGSELKNSLDVKMSLQMPGMLFDQKQIRFITIKDLPEIEFNGQYLTDRSGVRVIPVLHRPTLSELRSWELPLIVQQQLYGIERVTLIADDFGRPRKKFSDALKNCLAENYNIETDFLTWQKQHNGFKMLNSLPVLLPQMDQLSSDTVVIIPPLTDFNSIASVRTQVRVIAALLERIRNNVNIVKIFLAMPLPTPDNNSELERQIIKALQKLCRTYDIGFINSSSYIQQQEGWRDAYRAENDNPAVFTSYPQGLSGTIAEFFSKNIVK